LARAVLLGGQSRIIATAPDAASVDGLELLIQQLGGIPGRRLSIIDSIAATVPNPALQLLTASALVQHLAFDRMSAGAMERTGPTVGATAVRQALGYDGS